MADVYQMVTDRIIAIMEQGEIPWEQEWVNTVGTNLAFSHVSGKAYSVLNQMLLGIPGEWLTFKQAEAEGGHVKKGVKSRPVVFYKPQVVPVKDKDGTVMMKDGKEVTKTIPILKYYAVFHTEDCDGIKRKYLHTQEQMVRENSPIETCEQIMQEYLAKSGVKLTHYEQGRSYYSPAEDQIVLPHIWQFENAEAYYATAFHEMIHSTGASGRLNRLTNGGFGSEQYSKEELVAEIGAAILCHHAGIQSHRTETNSAAYLQGWLKALKNDKRLIVSAAGKAEKAVEFILGKKPEPDKEVE